MNPRIYAIAAAAIAGIALGYFTLKVTVLKPENQFADCLGGQVAGGADIGGPFTLIDENGQAVTDKDVIDRPTLVYFGYTFCPDVCPLDTSRTAGAVDLLAAQGYDVKQVFISVDPGRDTPQVMAEFTANFSPDMVGLTGTEAQIADAARAYRAFYQILDDDPVYYTVNHSAFTYLMSPDRGFLTYYAREDTSEQMAESVACFLDHAS